MSFQPGTKVYSGSGNTITLDVQTPALVFGDPLEVINPAQLATLPIGKRIIDRTNNLEYTLCNFTYSGTTPVPVFTSSSGVGTITGTPHQIIADAATGDITLSTPQNIDIVSDVQFHTLGIGEAPDIGVGILVGTNLPVGIGVGGTQTLISTNNIQSGILITPQFSPTNGGTELDVLGIVPVVAVPAGKTVTNSYMLKIAPTFVGNVGSSPTMYGIYCDMNMTAGTVNNLYSMRLTAPQGAVTNKYTAYFDTGVGFGVANKIDSGYTVAISGNTPILFTGAIGAGVGTTLNVSAGGILQTTASSLRFKENVTDLTFDTSDIFKLRPVEFDYIESKEHDFGFIAEEVFEVFPLLVNNDYQGKPVSLNYDKLSVILLVEVTKILKDLEKIKEQLNQK